MSTTDMNEKLSQHKQWVTLKSGKKIFLRPILPTDDHLLLDLFNKMSPQSRYLRFLSHHQTLSDDLLYRFTHLNYDDEFAIAAVVKEEELDCIVAVARYTNNRLENIADLAIAVRDDWQHSGLGTLLLSRVIDIGKEHGINRFGSMMDPQNTAVKKVIQKLGYEFTYYFRDGMYQVEILV